MLRLMSWMLVYSIKIAESDITKIKVRYDKGWFGGKLFGIGLKMTERNRRKKC